MTGRSATPRLPSKLPARGPVGAEVDLLLQLRGKLLPIEVKLGLAPPSTRSLETCMKDIGAARGYVVALAGEPREIRRGIVMSGLAELIEMLGLRPKAPR